MITDQQQMPARPGRSFFSVQLACDACSEDEGGAAARRPNITAACLALSKLQTQTDAETRGSKAFVSWEMFGWVGHGRPLAPTSIFFLSLAIAVAAVLAWFLLLVRV